MTSTTSLAREAALPEHARRVVAHLVGTKTHSGVNWKREGWAFMVRWDNAKQSEAINGGWSRNLYEKALEQIDADLAEVTEWVYVDNLSNKARAEALPEDVQELVAATRERAEHGRYIDPDILIHDNTALGNAVMTLAARLAEAELALADNRDRTEITTHQLIVAIVERDALREKASRVVSMRPLHGADFVKQSISKAAFDDLKTALQLTQPSEGK